MNREKRKYHNCPMCGSLCTVGGDDREGTHYYLPASLGEVEKELSRLEALLKSVAVGLREHGEDIWADRIMAELRCGNGNER